MKRVHYQWTNHYSESEPNNGYNAEWDFVDLGDGYTFEDYLNDNIDYGLMVESKNTTNEYIVYDKNHNEIDRYQIMKKEDISE